MRGLGRTFVLVFCFALWLGAQPASTSDFVGSNVCRTCHPDVWSTFYKNPHYRSIASGKEPAERTGCESCHGPGQAHVQARGGKATIVAVSELQPQAVLDNCLRCHAETLSRANIRRSFASIDASGFGRQSAGILRVTPSQAKCSALLIARVGEIMAYRSTVNFGAVGYSHTQDTGDGRSTPLGPAIGSSLPAFQAVQTFPITFRSPMARLSVRITGKIRWNVGYQYYGYNELFLTGEGYRAHTGYSSVLWSF